MYSHVHITLTISIALIVDTYLFTHKICMSYYSYVSICFFYVAYDILLNTIMMLFHFKKVIDVATHILIDIRIYACIHAHTIHIHKAYNSLVTKC